MPRVGTGLGKGPGGGGSRAARTVQELKQLGRDAGLPSSGKKLDLITRLSEDELNEAPVATVDASPVEKLADDDNWCEAH